MRNAENPQQISQSVWFVIETQGPLRIEKTRETMDRQIFLQKDRSREFKGCQNSVKNLSKESKSN